MPAGFTQSADNVMLSQIGDSLLHPAPPKYVAKFTIDEKCCELREDIDGDRYADHHDEHVEDTQGMVVRGIDDLSVADSGERHNSHVHGIQESNVGPSDDAIADDGYSSDGKH